MELFLQQSKEYQNTLLPTTCRARVSIEAATRGSWGFFLGLDGEHVGINRFGASAPFKCVQKEFGFTKEAVLATAQRVMDRNMRMGTSEKDLSRQQQADSPVPQTVSFFGY
jgi:transketolase